MTNYNAPLDEIKFVLNEVIGLDKVLQLEKFKDFTPDLIEAILGEAAKFADEKLAPLNSVGDKNGCKAHDGIIETPPGFKEAYSEFIANGWNGVPFSQNYGGQGLPWVISTAISEMWSGANMAFGLCPLLTQGAVESLSRHGSDAQKEKYLQKLVSGQWTGTMCLTESKAGSDLGAINTSATKNGEHYLIKGQKIFITYGEHDFTENIIHMVLARTPDAPKGSKGISLFIVPKFLEDGTRNDVNAISIEHKLGIHASPTAVLNFGENNGAVGYLVGEENSGLKYMFTMMNNARLGVGVEGIAVAENSHQKARAFANEREQGGHAIINYPDVKRMLITIKANTDAMRALAYYAAMSIDMELEIGNQESCGSINYKNIVDILIPVIKAHSTDNGFEASSLAVQVFGGMGFIEETGIAQNLRDSRITMIYEGTNGIQALDLVMRKIILNDGALFADLCTAAKGFYKDSGHFAAVDKAFSNLELATKHMQGLVANDNKKAGFVAHYYLKMFGLVMGAVMLAASEKAANLGLKNNADKAAFYNEKLELAQFYMDYILPEAEMLGELIAPNPA
jgi:alkylation response protein AidB-like acyl-CoA dehydrogenase